jgi:hypothetical protein
VQPSSGSIKLSPPGGEWAARIRKIVQSLGLALLQGINRNVESPVPAPSRPVRNNLTTLWYRLSINFANNAKGGTH